MTTPSITHAIILAAGLGKRMQSSLPKVMHTIGHRPMINHVINACEQVNIANINVVVNPNIIDIISPNIAPCNAIIQYEQLGTGHALQTSIASMDNLPDDDYVLVLYGDTPFIDKTLLTSITHEPQHDINIVAFEAQLPHQYGRIIISDGVPTRIVEDKDCDDTQKQITLANSGIMHARVGMMRHLLPMLNNNNNQQEYYLTDIVKYAHQHGYKACVTMSDEAVCQGVNSPQELALAESIFQQKMRDNFMSKGVKMLDASTVYFSADTVIAPHAIIDPFVVLYPAVHIGAHSHIKSFSHLEGVHIKAHCAIGPYARLRPGTVIDDDVKIGNFVETKKAHFAAKSKASHLSYIGDATIDVDANIGAGTITCNYDGYKKSHTHIGKNAFIGSNSALVAPVEIGDNAIIGAGSVIRKSVESDSLALSQAAEKHYKNKATSIRRKNAKQQS